MKIEFNTNDCGHCAPKVSMEIGHNAAGFNGGINVVGVTDYQSGKLASIRLEFYQMMGGKIEVSIDKSRFDELLKKVQEVVK